MRLREGLGAEVEHIDIKSFNSVPLIDQFGKMAFQARNMARAAEIFNEMVSDTDCTVILCMAGSLISAGLKKVIYDLIDNNMVDAVISNGAIIVDQDYFEALGFKHYQGRVDADDTELMKQHIDRIYDTYIREDELRVCDFKIAEIADSLETRPYSSREFIWEMGKDLVKNGCQVDSVVKLAHEKDVPIFVPAFSDCSAGFGLVVHQFNKEGQPHLSIDSAKDFLELTKIKIDSKKTGLFMLGGGVPKNFAQDVTVSAEILGKDAGMHEYAVQITLATENDGALSGSTLKEAHSWGKVTHDKEQMVYSESTVAFPLIASYAYHKQGWKNRKPRKLGMKFQGVPV